MLYVHSHLCEQFCTVNNDTGMWVVNKQAHIVLVTTQEAQIGSCFSVCQMMFLQVVGIQNTELVCMSDSNFSQPQEWLKWIRSFEHCVLAQKCTHNACAWTQCYKYPPTPLSEHKVMCTAHGPFFMRLQYTPNLPWRRLSALVTILVTQTNLYADRLRTAAAPSPSNRWYVSMNEILAYIGIHVAMGIVNLPSLRHFCTKPRQMDRMHQLRVIEPVETPTEWRTGWLSSPNYWGSPAEITVS